MSLISKGSPLKKIEEEKLRGTTETADKTKGKEEDSLFFLFCVRFQMKIVYKPKRYRYFTTMMTKGSLIWHINIAKNEAKTSKYWYNVFINTRLYSGLRWSRHHAQAKALSDAGQMPLH